MIVFADCVDHFESLVAKSIAKHKSKSTMLRNKVKKKYDPERHSSLSQYVTQHKENEIQN